MIQHNINSKRKDSGFTIVELLVVIVVIGILAAITIVSYTGVTNRAKGAQAKSNAASVITVAEAVNADNGVYPVTYGEFSSLPSVTKLPSGITTGFATVPTATTGQNTFQLYTLTTNPETGGKVVFWDYEKGNLCTSTAGNANGVTVDTCLYYGAANITSNSGTTGLTVFAS